MTINRNASYGFGHGSYGVAQQSPSSYFSQIAQQGGQSGGSVASLVQQIQSTAQQLQSSGEDAQDAFTNAIQQMSRQLNPALGGSTASGGSGMSTTSAASSDSTDAMSIFGHGHRHAGPHMDSIMGPTTSLTGSGSLSSTLSQLMQNQASNSSVAGLLASQSGADSTPLSDPLAALLGNMGGNSPKAYFQAWAQGGNQNLMSISV